MKSILRRFRHLASGFAPLAFGQDLEVLLVRAELDRLKGEPRHQRDKSLIPFGYKVYSQQDEDGILREIFRRIGVTNKVFVEFGVGNGLENNTLALLFEGWRGLWIEASAQHVNAIKTHFANVIRAGHLHVLPSFATKGNIDALISSHVRPGEIDLLSVDIDGNDFHIFSAITCICPRVVVMEYNAKFPPPILFCMAYRESHAWQGDDCFGASLKYLEVNFEKRGYRLVGCSLSGVNAFFVRSDLAGDHFLRPFSAENHYEPARYYLARLSSGHRPSYQTLGESLACVVEAFPANF
jgi:hypothetical protein